MKILKNHSLSKLNTFGVKAKAKFFVEIKTEKELAKLFKTTEFQQNKRIFLGGGSNILFTKDFEGIVAVNKLKGIQILKEDSKNVIIRSMGGENWHDLVMFAVNHKYWGLENLALIPGTVGAAPVQNIGAYGTELKDILFEVEAREVKTGIKKIFTNKQCGFGYRESIFKNKLKGKYFITAVTFRLSKNKKAGEIYQTLKEYVKKNKIKIKSPRDISDAVITIRQSKLPDTKILGNAGSFFKNVYVNKNKLKRLQEKFPDIPFFKEPSFTRASKNKREKIKIPSGWLIEQCQWRGKKLGKVGVYEKQALVLINYGGATGGEVLYLANEIIKSVKKKFGLEITPEVNLI